MGTGFDGCGRCVEGYVGEFGQQGGIEGEFGQSGCSEDGAVGRGESPDGVQNLGGVVDGERGGHLGFVPDEAPAAADDSEGSGALQVAHAGDDVSGEAVGVGVGDGG
ncbi:hypothetical protein HRbin32_02025 [bacterium HR32]|nr:hypothetical protein HRbin32_02025 [bacterium HR32]